MEADKQNKLDDTRRYGDALRREMANNEAHRSLEREHKFKVEREEAYKNH